MTRKVDELAIKKSSFCAKAAKSPNWQGNVVKSVLIVVINLPSLICRFSFNLGYFKIYNL